MSTATARVLSEKSGDIASLAAWAIKKNKPLVLQDVAKALVADHDKRHRVMGALLTQLDQSTALDRFTRFVFQ